MKMAFHRASRRSPHRVDDFPILLHIRLSARYPPVDRAKRPRSPILEGEPARRPGTARSVAPQSSAPDGRARRDPNFIA